MAEYPASIKTFTNPTTTNQMSSPSHSTQHSDANNEITAIQTELGTSPSGSYSTVAVRISTLESSVVTGVTHATSVGTSHSLVVANSATIASNVSAIATNAADIATNSTAISTNSANIATNSTAIATNSANIAVNATAIATNAVQAAVGVDHSTANGSSHSYIDQDVTSGASPTFSGSNFSAIPGTAITLASQSTGDIAYYTGTAWERVAIGASGEVLTVDSAATAPEWSAPAAGVTVSSSVYNPTVTCAGGGSYTLSGDWNTFAYYRVGSMVNVNGSLWVTTASGTASGVIRVTLPFVVAAGTSGAQRPVFMTNLFLHGGNFSGQLRGVATPGDTYFSVQYINATGSSSNVAVADINTSWRLTLGATYVTDTA